jgi:hypothetical protein
MQSRFVWVRVLLVAVSLLPAAKPEGEKCVALSSLHLSPFSQLVGGGADSRMRPKCTHTLARYRRQCNKQYDTIASRRSERAGTRGRQQQQRRIGSCGGHRALVEESKAAHQRCLSDDRWICPESELLKVSTRWRLWHDTCVLDMTLSLTLPVFLNSADRLRIRHARLRADFTYCFILLWRRSRVGCLLVAVDERLLCCRAGTARSPGYLGCVSSADAAVQI